jgi:hypothetical protein
MKGEPATMQRRVQYSIVPLGLLSVVFWLYIFLGIDFIPQIPKFQNLIPEPVFACFNGSLGFGKVMLLSLPSYLLLPCVVLTGRRTDRRDAMSLVFEMSRMDPALV